MSRYFLNRPERYLTKAEIEEITVIYLADEISVRSIAIDFGVNHKNIRALCRRLGLPKRSVGWRPASVMLRVNAEKERRAAKPRSPAAWCNAPGSINWGFQKPIQMMQRLSPLERAKDLLRRHGHVVFNADIVDARDKGLIQVDCRKWTHDRVMQAAAALSGAAL